MGDTFKLTFCGTRGTRTVTGPQYNRFGGHTTCLYVQAGARHLIFDSGSGVIGLSKRLLGAHFQSGDPNPLVTYLFHTHAHFDHICGLPYFAPFYVPNTTTYIYGPRSPICSFKEAASRLIESPFHPVSLHEMPGEKHWLEIGEPDVVYFVKGERAPLLLRPYHASQRHLVPDPDQVETTIECLRGYSHPKCGVMIYRITHAGRSVTFATDVEGYVLGDQRLIRFASGSDVLIHDAMYTRERYTSKPVPTQGWGHSTVEIAADTAKQANAKRLYLIHHDPDHDDDELERIESIAQNHFAESISARDGDTLDLIETFEPAAS